MSNFFIGVITGIVLSTVGATGVAKWIDKGVESTKIVIQENVK
jgi:hypothetical protein